MDVIGKLDYAVSDWDVYVYPKKEWFTGKEKLELFRLAKLGAAAEKRFECHRQPFVQRTIIVGGYDCTDCSDLEFCRLRQEV